MFEFSRGGNACQDGLLKEGLVDAWRNPTPDLDIFTNTFRRLRMPPQQKEYGMNIYPFHEKGEYFPIDLTAVPYCKESWEKMITFSRQPDPRFSADFKKIRRMDNGPKLCNEIRSIGELKTDLLIQPIVIDGEMTVSVNLPCSELHIIGNVSMPYGWPIGGTYGEPVAEYTVLYSDGTESVFTMRNGTDITTATAQYGPSRIDPIASNCPRALYLHYDFDFEHYIANHCILPTDSHKTVSFVSFKLINNNYSVLLYGLTAKQ